MKIAARNDQGEWLPDAIELANFFQCLPEDLFSEPQQYNKLEKNRVHAEVTYAEIRQLTARQQEPVTPELAIQAKQLRQAVARVLTMLTPREERVIRMRFGFEAGGEQTLEEIREQFGVTVERIRQIEAKALRKLKHDTRAKFLVGVGVDEKVVEDERWGPRIVYSLDDEVLKAL